MKENKVALLGTCNNSTWRDKFIKLIDIPFFNPVVKDWTPECQENEEKEKNDICNIHFYCITKEMTGVFSIAEVINSCHMKNKKTILHVIPDGFETFQLKSLKAVVDMVIDLGGIAYMDKDLSRSSRLLNLAFTNIYKY